MNRATAPKHKWTSLDKAGIVPEVRFSRDQTNSMPTGAFCSGLRPREQAHEDGLTVAPYRDHNSPRIEEPAHIPNKLLHRVPPWMGGTMLPWTNTWGNSMEDTSAVTKRSIHSRGCSRTNSGLQLNTAPRRAPDTAASAQPPKRPSTVPVGTRRSSRNGVNTPLLDVPQGAFESIEELKHNLHLVRTGQSQQMLKPQRTVHCGLNAQSPL